MGNGLSSAATNILFPPQAILVDLERTETTALLEVLASRAAETAGVTAENVRRQIVHDVLAVESLPALSVAQGVGCFRAVSEHVDRVVACLAIPLRIFPAGTTRREHIEAAFLFLAPPRNRNMLIKLSASAERLAESKEARSKLFETNDTAALSEFLQEWFTGFDADLRAKDIMRPPFFFLTPDASLREVVLHMLRYDLEAVGIVDSEHRLVGEITSDMLFKLGVPDFFSQLKSVSFLGDFDPFEKYFEIEEAATAGSVLSPDVAVVDEFAPIIEIIFRLTVERRWKVYVLRDGKLAGVIDRIRVLQMVLYA